jgi:hypothetical protein
LVGSNQSKAANRSSGSARARNFSILQMG